MRSWHGMVVEIFGMVLDNVVEKSGFQALK
jgi:hypothetical protein